MVFVSVVGFAKALQEKIILKYLCLHKGRLEPKELNKIHLKRLIKY